MAGTRFRVFANLYKDSVTLMQLAQKLRERDGIEQASCLMATPANLAQLEQADLSIDAAASPNDLLVVVRGDADACEAALGAADALLKDSGTADRGGQAAFALPLTSLALGVAQADDADLALISVPGDYAAAEAMKALALGLHVMLFSDNVPLAEERAVKRVARDKGLLVMGPDCGTAIVNGVPLGFANVVRRGDIGLVAASGTGLQEVTCRIHHLGGGVSQALGTGGRDLKEEIGGITMLQGLQALAADAATRVIVLISKPPAPEIARRIEAAAAQAGKPVVVHFLGAAPRAMPTPLVAATSLRQAADLAVALARGDAARATAVEPPAAALATIDERCAAMAPGQHAVRALFTGGTFCYEAQLAFNVRGLPCRSNAPTHDSLPFDGRFDGHVMLDLGDDDYTRGRPHPMIDPSVRDAMVRAQGADASTAAILFDVVLGYGAHADPAQSLAAALADAQAQARAQGRTLALIGHVCGTEGDPQDRGAQVRMLREVGAVLADSNIEAALLAAHCAQRCATRPARG
ncbi:MAG TPA: acyl-CoA synthetase FdrA [Burkholderiaceae bacterium]|nr:acyl-CoA synthetase FdrA [Burkholderiaceae bacterium]